MMTTSFPLHLESTSCSCRAHRWRCDNTRVLKCHSLPGSSRHLNNTSILFKKTHGALTLFSGRRERLESIASASRVLEDSRPAFPDLKIVVYSARPYVRESLSPVLSKRFPNTEYFEANLGPDTANLCKGADVVVLFVNDKADAEVVNQLADNGVKHIAMRCAGFDKVNLAAAAMAGITVSRVPSYSPTSIAEHALALLMTLNRKLHRVANRIREGNFTLSGLQGYEIGSKTIGVIGTGRIGKTFCRIMKLGFGCRVLAYDKFPAQDMMEMGIEYMELDEILPQCMAVCIFCPLNDSTYHLMDEDKIRQMKKGAFLINVSRGGLVDTQALLRALRSGHLGGAGLDVYENEESLFFEDFSTRSTFHADTWDGMFAELEVLPNVLISPHSAFLTYEALDNISATVADNILEFAEGKPITNLVEETPRSTANVIPSINEPTRDLEQLKKGGG